METITNLASTAATTASKLIYGDNTTATTTQNETAGKEPISGEQGKGTATEPFDKGNEGTHSHGTHVRGQADVDAEDATAAATSLSDAKIEPTHTLEPTGAVREPKDLINAYDEAAGPNTTTANTTTSETTAPQTTAITDKLWKPTDIDAVKPSVADPAAAPETGVGNTEDKKGDLWRPTEVYQESAPGVTDGTVSPMDTAATSSNLASTSSGNNNNLDAYTLDSNTNKVSSDKETAAIKKLDSHDPATGKEPSTIGTWAQKAGRVLNKADGVAGLAENKSGHKDKPETKTEAKTELSKKVSPSPSGEDDDDKSKMSALKDKLKTKLHIGHKDK
jgi:hypothetical protein